jgi:hypothetical protein
MSGAVLKTAPPCYSATALVVALLGLALIAEIALGALRRFSGNARGVLRAVRAPMPVVAVMALHVCRHLSPPFAEDRQGAYSGTGVVA